MTFKKLNRSQLHTIATILDRAEQTVQYIDPNTNAQKTIKTYSGDWKYTSKRIGKVEGVACNLIAKKRR